MNLDELRAQNTALIEENEDLRRRIGELEERVRAGTSRTYPPMEQIAREENTKVAALPARARVEPMPEVATNDDLYDAIKRRLIAEAPVLLKVLLEKPELEIEVRRATVTTDGTGWLGRTALLITEGFFDSPRKSGDVFKELARRGATGISARADEACKSLLAKGFLTREEEGYRAVKGMKVRIVEAA